MIGVQMTVDPARFEGARRETEKQIQTALGAAVKELLSLTEAQQIKAYTATGSPPQPEGSDYIRTFTLKGSSKKRLISRRLPAIEGEWFATVDYASYVLGRREDQAPIHVGRWKSEEQVAEAVGEQAPGVVEKYLEGLG